MSSAGDKVALTGGCHCGAVAVTFATRRRPEELPLRACACSFCRRHGARCASDPAGSVRIDVADPARVSRYRFALGTADFLVCARCGVYVAAVLAGGPKAYAIVNVNALDAAFPQAAASVSYDHEDEAARRARRESNWTPAEVCVHGA